MFPEHGCHICLVREIPLGTRVPTTAAHVDEVGQGLSSSSALVEIRSLAAERIRRDHLLRLEARVTDRTAQLDLLKRRHANPPAPGVPGEPQGKKRASRASLVRPEGRHYHSASNAPATRRSRTCDGPRNISRRSLPAEC